MNFNELPYYFSTKFDEEPQNQGKIAVSDTKTLILCSKCPKMGVSKAKKAQKPRFCARETNAGLRETESEALGLLEVGLWACGS